MTNGSNSSARGFDVTNGSNGSARGFDVTNGSNGSARGFDGSDDISDSCFFRSQFDPFHNLTHYT